MTVIHLIRLLCRRFSLVFSAILLLKIRASTADRSAIFGGNDQDWGFVTVRPHSHMFWWLYYTAAPVANYTERPLIIWLQGGPGMPSSGYGNFMEIGPFTLNLERRNDTVIQQFNVLFVDNPIGVGFSYTSHPAQMKLNRDDHLVHSGEEIGRDLVAFLTAFLTQKPEFRRTPIYIFGESYGGKMAVEFAYQLMMLTPPSSTLCNLAGIGLGDAYISPVHYLRHYGPLAFEMGLVDRNGYEIINNLSIEIQRLIEKGDFWGAADVETRMSQLVASEMPGIDIYNMLVKRNTTMLPTIMERMGELEMVLNHVVKPDLDLPKNTTWSFLKRDVHRALKGDLMRPVTDKIEYLLNSTDIKIIVYNGNLDLIVNTAGTISWMDDLRWSGHQEWLQTRFSPLEINMLYEGYSKSVQNLVFYAILRAGHSVPVDNMSAMQELLKRELLFSDDSVEYSVNKRPKLHRS